MKSFDLRETLLPFSFLQIVNHCKRIGPGEVVEVIAGDESVAADLACLLPEPLVTLTATECVDRGGTYFRIRLKKT